VLLLGAPLRAQSAAMVPASSPLYDRLESISAFFPIRGLSLGERPLSRREIQRVLDRLALAIDSAFVCPARKEWARHELAAVSTSMNRERGVYRTPRSVLAFANREELFASDARSERFITNGFGTLDALTNPFEATPPRQGWPTIRGVSLIAGMSTLFGLGRQFALTVEPLLMVTDPRDDTTHPNARLHRASVRGVLRNVAIDVGADERKWGQSPIGSMFISGNAQPLPAVSIGVDTPITLPWLFRLAGPVRGTLMVAELGGDQDPPHAKLAGWQVTMTPWARFELGVAVQAQTGGNGGPPATFFRRVVDRIPVIDAIAPQHADLQMSNKLAGGNLRLRFPELSGLDFYYELQIDDFDARRLRSSLVDDAGHLLGLRLPLLVRGGELTWRAEWHHTSLRLYEHSQFRSGVTYHDHIIGNPLGPNASGAYLSVAWRPSSATQLALQLAEETRDPSFYATTSANGRDVGFRFVRLSDDPDIRRRRGLLSLERPLAFGAISIEAGYNHTWRTGGMRPGYNGVWRTVAPARNEWIGRLAMRSHLLPTF